MIQRSTVLELVKEKGPLLPKDVIQVTRESLLFVSAMLSELVSAKKIKYSHLKVGSSPLYYHEGQEEKLQEYSHKLPKHLHEAYKYLKEKIIVKDLELPLRIRAGIRDLKDFAHPFTRTTKEGKELFWKWYLTTPEEATKVVAQQFKPKVLEKKTTLEEDKKPKIEASKPEVNHKEAQETLKAEPEVKVVKVEMMGSGNIQVQEIKEQKKEKKTESSEAAKALQEMKQLLESERKKLAEEREKFYEERDALEKQKTLKEGEGVENDPFYQEVIKFLESKNMQMTAARVIKKGTEIEGSVIVPSEFGGISFLMRAKTKKRLNRKDLEELHNYAMEKKKPLLVVLQAELPKKTIESIEQEFSLIKTVNMADGSKDN